MATINIQHNPDLGRIQVRAPFAYKDVLKAIRGGLWNPDLKAWTYPYTSHAIVELCAQLMGCDNNLTLYLPPELLNKAQQYKKVHLPEIKDQPYDCKTRPWGHQPKITNWLQFSDACIVDGGMGIGKTKCVIDAIFAGAMKLVLIVCPAKVLDVWESELETHAPGPYTLVILRTKISTQKRGQLVDQTIKLAHLNQDDRPIVVVTNYEAVWREGLARVLKKYTWDKIFADEVHRIKAAGGKASRFMAALREKHAKGAAGLSGTILPHSFVDAYGIFRFVDPSIFGSSKNRFLNRYAVMGGYDAKQVIEIQNHEEFVERMARITVKVDRSVLDLPAVNDIYRSVDLSTEEHRIYAELEEEFCTEIRNETITVTNALTKLLRLQQVTSGYLPMENGDLVAIGTSKRDYLVELFEDIGPDPLVVFCRFRHDLDNVRAMAKQDGRPYFELSGRKNDLKEFQKSANNRDVIGVQIQAGGEGISLVRSCFGVYYSLGFSLGQYDQSRCRLHRPGQENPVRFIHLLAKGTVDEKIVGALRKRRDTIKEILDQIKNKT